LLARRVTDSHERKAAVELQALRDGLARLGFVPKAQTNVLSPEPVVNTQPDFRAARLARPMRPTRFTRLPRVQQLAQIVEEIARWLSERFGLEPKATSAEKVEPAETMKQIEKNEQAESVKPAEPIKPTITVRKALQQKLDARRKLGRGITPPGDTGQSHSRGIGV
jgi:hypothetical protein